MSSARRILTLSCVNRPGIVAKVSAALFNGGFNILDAQQFDDTETGEFCMRVSFNPAQSHADVETFRETFKAIAVRFAMTDGFAAKLQGRCVNIHHSFLPGFKGAKPNHQAHRRGVKLIGATAHFVTSDLDEGPIIEQVSSA